jgi:predicted RNase H-like HicB family nuclease
MLALRAAFGNEYGTLKTMNIKVIIEPGEDGYVVAHVPSIKSCWSQGKTKEEALRNIREAIDLYLEPEPNELKEDQELVELTV